MGSNRTAHALKTAQADTKELIFMAAETLFALHGFQKVTVRDIAAEAAVNVAALNYYYGSKTTLANEIFRRRSTELNRERFHLLKLALEENQDRPPVRKILHALFSPPLNWLYSDDRRRTSIQVVLRGRSEGTQEMRNALKKHVSHLDPFVSALKTACPKMAENTIYWRLHFCLALVHNNRPAEFERLALLSKGLTSTIEVGDLLDLMLDFAEAGFLQA